MSESPGLFPPAVPGHPDPNLNTICACAACRGYVTEPRPVTFHFTGAEPKTLPRQVTFLFPKPEKKPGEWDDLVEALRG